MHSQLTIYIYMRLAVYHHRRGNDQEFEQHPWTPKSLWEPQPYINRKLEECLDEVYNELFSPGKHKASF